MSLSTTLVLMTTTFTWADQQVSSQSLKVEPVLITLIHQVEVPARDQGAITEVAVEIGKIVKKDRLSGWEVATGADCGRRIVTQLLASTRMSTRQTLPARRPWGGPSNAVPRTCSPS